MNQKYKVGLNLVKYYKKSAIACVISLILGVGATLAFGYAYFYDHDESLVAEYTEQLKIKDLEKEEVIKQLTEEKEQAVAEASQHQVDLEEQLEEITRLHKTQQEISAADFSLLRKYWYVLRDGPNNGTLTLDVLRYADDQCKKWNLNPDWVWHMYEHESRWTTTAINSRSGARGIGQVMPSTGRSFWQDVLGHGAGSFSVDMLDDPFVNIEITTAHLGRDIANGSTFREAVAHYCGGGVNAYWNTVVGMAREHGITLEGNYEYH